jgi:hypothetical protein
MLPCWPRKGRLSAWAGARLCGDESGTVAGDQDADGWTRV